MDIKQLKEIIENHKKWIHSEEAGERANLTGANLRDANLWGANLRDANLTGANLTDANLTGADLRDANLWGANLTGANLWGADLRGANLTGANLTGANLTGADLRGANLTGANLTGANLWGCAGNRNQIKSLFISELWPITYTSEYLQIGCQHHPIAAWWDFSDGEISQMDGKALDFWNEFRDFLRSTIERFPATPTGLEESEAGR